MKRIPSIVKNNSAILKNFSSLALLQIFNLCLPLITFPYLVKVVGVDGYGLLSFSLATIAYFNILIDYGFNLTATREVSVNRDNRNKLIEIFSSVISIKVFFLVICFLVLLFLVCFIEKFNSNSKMYLYTFGIVIGQALFPIWFFQGVEKMKYITYLNMVSRSIFTIAIFVFVKEEKDVLLVPVFNTFGGVLSALISFFILRNTFKVKFKIQKVSVLIKYLKESWDVFVIDFLPNLYNNFSTFFLGLFASFEVVGIYALAVKLVNVLNSFIYVIRNATYPYLNKDKSKINLITKITVCVGALFSTCTFIFSEYLIPLIFGNAGVKSLTYLYILGFSPLFLSIAIAYGTNKLLVLKQDRMMRNVTVKYSLTGFFIALILIPKYGAYGAAITVLVTRFLMAILTYRAASKFNTL